MKPSYERVFSLGRFPGRIRSRDVKTGTEQRIVRHFVQEQEDNEKKEERI